MLKLVIALYILGIILLSMEIYVPGGVLGTAGIVFLILSIVLSFISVSVQFGFFMLFLVSLSIGIAFYLALKYFPGSKIGKMLFLSRNIDSNVAEESSSAGLLGKKGIALTDLRPSGTAKIDGRRLDVVTQGDYIQKNDTIEIIEVEGNRIVVKKLS